MPDFLLELRSEEIPARMQARARVDLARLFAEHLARAGLAATAIETHATPRRLVLIARGLPEATQGIAEEIKGPRADAPPQALAGFLGKVGLSRDQLVERADAKGNRILFAVIDRPGRATAAVLAEAIPAIIRAFPWPKSMRWGAASTSTESPRWVRPLQGIVALLGEEIVPFEIAGIISGAATLGHRFHHPGIITIGSADDYEAKLRACHVILDADERARIIREGARAAASAAGLTLVEDEALVAENAGLTEWPVPLLGRFDPAFLEVPREVIELTMRTNQKYFALVDPPRDGEVAARSADGGGVSVATEDPLHHTASRRGSPPRSGEDDLAPNFVCTANIAAADGGAAIVAGNERVLSARLSDARFFWEADLKVPLEDQASKLGDIVFHEKLGTVADKVDRVAKLARWLVEEGIVSSSPAFAGEGDHAQHGGGAWSEAEGSSAGFAAGPSTAFGGPPPRAELGEERDHLATLAERAARLCKADLVTQSVGEFPELQGLLGAHLARAQGEDPQVADAIRDHYKPVGQGDEVPTASVTVAVSLADKLDTLVSFFILGQHPTGSKDPYALRRAAIALISLIVRNGIRCHLGTVVGHASQRASWWPKLCKLTDRDDCRRRDQYDLLASHKVSFRFDITDSALRIRYDDQLINEQLMDPDFPENFGLVLGEDLVNEVLDFFADRLKVQQREAGVRHDLIDAVFALGGEDDLVRLLARVHALQAFVETPEGRDLLAGYKRAANILKKEGWSNAVAPAEAGASGQEDANGSAASGNPVADPPRMPASAGMTIPLSYNPEPVEQSLIDALVSAEPRARAAIEAEDFEAAMTALAALRGPVDAFFENVIVNDPDPAKRLGRLALLARMRDAVHGVADFSKIEG